MTFNGFGEKALPFLKALDFHQSREWFKENEPLFQSELYHPLLALVETMTERFDKHGLPYKGAGKASMFRIYRDVRFSKDKRPYNRHVSALLTPSGSRKDGERVFYMHFGLERCFMACGTYGPEAPRLQTLRNRIREFPEAFRRLTGELAGVGLAFMQDDALKRTPKGYEDVTDVDLIAVLRLKHFIVEKTISPERILSPGLADDLEAFALLARPLDDWLASSL